MLIEGYDYKKGVTRLQKRGHTTTKKGWNKNDQLGFEADKELTSGFKYLTTILLPSSGLTLHELCKKLRGEGEF